METNNANVEKSFILSDWLTVEEVGTYLRISRTTAYKMINDCTIPSVRLGRVLRISKHELNDVLLRGHGDKTATDRSSNAVQEKNSTDSYCNDILSLKRA